MSVIEIAQPAEHDIAELCQLLAVLFSQEVEFDVDAEAQRRGLAAIIANPEIGSIFIAKEQGAIVGMVNLLFTVSTALGTRVALLEDLVVLPSARKSGIGTRLLEYAIAFARAQHCARITVLTDRDNDRAQRLYQRHGFIASSMLPLRLMLE